MPEPTSLTPTELHDWAEREGLYIPLTPRGTAYLRSLLGTWAGLNQTAGGPRTVPAGVHRDRCATTSQSVC